MTDFFIKRNDTSPAIEYQLADEDGTGIDLSSADVRFLMRDRSDTTIVDDDTSGNVVLSNASNGTVKYEWQPSDTETKGLYDAEWEVEYSDGSLETFPNSEYITVKIIEDIG